MYKRGVCGLCGKAKEDNLNFYHDECARKRFETIQERKELERIRKHNGHDKLQGDGHPKEQTGEGVMTGYSRTNHR